MPTDGSQTNESASKLIDERIRDLDDWRGPVLKRMRELIHEADAEVVEEWKWRKQSSPEPPSGRTTAASARARSTSRS